MYFETSEQQLFRINLGCYLPKQPSRGVLKKRCSENMQQINRRTPIPKSDFNKHAEVRFQYPCRSAISMKLLCNFVEIAIRYGCSPVNLLHIFRTPFLRKSSGWLLMYLHYFEYQMMCCRCIFKFSNTKAQKAPLVLQQFDVPSINIQQ